ncbi:hypothetical protein M0R45_004346 [Rubus argutus]|uniref:Uncharacterized protein n=1 Tax=Rubus argutus TaxID=59490 RepID=A0AAW1YJG7_RUBAR
MPVMGPNSIPWAYYYYPLDVPLSCAKVGRWLSQSMGLLRTASKTNIWAREDLTLALSLVRFSPLFNEEIKLTEKKYGLVLRVFIVCDQDLGIKEDLQMWMIRKNPPNEVKVINGSDHMVMFSRPLELFSNLLKVAEKYS